MQRSYRIGIDARLYSQTGVGRYIRSLISELAKIDRKNQYVLFINSADEEKIPYLGDNFKQRVVDIRWHTLAEQLVFPIILYKENLDLVHFPYFSVPIVYFRPFVVTIHDLTPLTHATGKASTMALPFYYLKHRAYQMVLSNAIRRACRIIVPSGYTKEVLEEHFPKASHKTFVTYEGVTKVRIKQEKKLIKGNYFLYVGNAYPHKNLERLIKAFLQLYQSHAGLQPSTIPACRQARRGLHTQTSGGARWLRSSEVFLPLAKSSKLGIKQVIKLVLVGGDDFFYQRLKKKWGKNKQIIFFGSANDKQLANLYRNAIALVFPSLSEGFGLPTLEAMAYGCLVIASAIPSLEEICGEAAVYIDPLNTESIVDKMKKALLENKRYQENIQKGLNLAKGFSWRRMAVKTHHIYESCFSLRQNK